MFNIIFFSLGILINTFSYSSFMPVLIAAMLFMTGYVILVISPLGGKAERKIFKCIFTIGLFIAGIGAFYANQLGDFFQNNSDARWFFEESTNTAKATLNEIKSTSEGSLAIVLWRTVYDFFALLGFEKRPYIGITVNIICVAFSGVIAIKMSRLLFGNDQYRFRRLTWLIVGCGLFWLFTSIHLRDAIVLFITTILIYFWLFFLVRPDIGRRLFTIIAITLLTSLSFSFLRTEFFFVPIAMTFAAVIALFMGNVERRYSTKKYMLIGIGGAVCILLEIFFFVEILTVVEKQLISYNDLSISNHNSASLGVSLILNQPLPVRLILGSIYLFIFPIPFWSGFQLDSVYHLFKSFNVIFFYFVLPLIIISFWQIIRYKSIHSPAVLFLVFIVLGFTFSVALTSLETRHWGVFLIPMFILACLPDLRISSNRKKYKSILLVVLISMGFIHLLWTTMKFV